MQKERLFRRKPILAGAVQWFRFGDHPDVVMGEDNEAVLYIKGKAVKVKTGNWIVRELDGSHYVFDSDFFEKYFQPAEQSYLAAEAKFETFSDLEEAQEYRAVYGGYLLQGNDSYIVCDEERALEFLCLKLSVGDARMKLKELQAMGFDETKIN